MNNHDMYICKNNKHYLKSLTVISKQSFKYIFDIPTHCRNVDKLWYRFHRILGHQQTCQLAWNRHEVLCHSIAGFSNIKRRWNFSVYDFANKLFRSFDNICGMAQIGEAISCIFCGAHLTFLRGVYLVHVMVGKRHLSRHLQSIAFDT